VTGKEKPMRRRAKPARAEVEAKPSAAGESRKSEGSTVHDLEKQLAEALRSKAEALGRLQTRDRELAEAQEEQTATSEILRIISQSPTEVQPVFDAIVHSAAALCHAPDVIILIADRDALRIVASVGSVAASVRQSQLVQRGAVPLTRGTVSGRAVIDRCTVHVHDVSAMPDNEFPEGKVLQREYGGHGTTLAVPLLREGMSLGVITLLRNEVSPFTDRQVALLETFADQAVIAIENTRLFDETKEALERQTATSEILSVISRATTDVQPVLDAIVQSAVRLCDGVISAAFLVDGDHVDMAAHHNFTEAGLAAMRSQWPRRVTLDTITGRAILERQVVHIRDVETDDIPLTSLDVAKSVGYRSLVAVPMIREGQCIGSINVSRPTLPFSNKQIELLKTFAAQAVIAIENVRLFTELLKDIYASGTHLLSLINDILDLSKIEAGRMELELTDFHLPQAIANALTLVRERAGRRGIALAHTMDERLGEIRGDERKIKQVLLNLLSNAVKFTSEGGRIEVAAVSKDGLAEVSVSDTGVGIAPEDQEKVFEEFRQVGAAEKKAEGTGLGLTLCRKFVELHDGNIWVKSQVGVGSTFTFTIPLRRGE
jgi:signal transduction histidine kinase